MARVEIDQDALKQLAGEVGQRWAAEKQPTFDRIDQSHGGKPVEEVEAAVRAACQQEEITPDDAQLHAWATTISDGNRIVLRPAAG